jgi:ubiquinone biosynthesis protein
MFATIRNIRRLWQVARVLGAHDALLPHEYAENAPTTLKVLSRAFGRPKDEIAKLPPGERLAKALEKMGPSAIKLGQLLATRADIVGAQIAHGLESLQDRLPPFGDDEARKIVERDFGRKISEAFSGFGPSIAAASIAQVHEAQTNENPSLKVAVKILRPNIVEDFARDFSAFRFAARLAERVSREARRLRLRALVETMAASVALELDLRMEGAAACELAENMRDQPAFLVPAIDWSRTSAHVLTTEWIEGVPLRDASSLSAAGQDTKSLAVIVLQSFLTQALRDGFFHADLHPGNLFVDSEGRIHAVDFGIMGRLDQPMRRFLAETLGGFLARDYIRVAQVHFDAGFVPKSHDVETFAQALRAVGEPIFGLGAKDVSMARLLEQLFETTRRFDMPLQPQLILLQKTMVVVEGVARMLDPEFDIWETSRPIVEEWMVANLGPEARLREAAEGISNLGRLAQHLPQVLQDTEMIAGQLADGGLRLHPDSVRAISTSQLRRTRHVRIALWIAAGALGFIAFSGL